MAWVDRSTLSNWKKQAGLSSNKRSAIDNEMEDARLSLGKARQNAIRESNASFNDSRIYDAQKQLQSDYESFSEELRLEIGRQNKRYNEELKRLRSEIRSNSLDIDSIERRMKELNRNFDSALKKIEQRENAKQIRAKSYLMQLIQIVEHLDKLHPDDFELLYQDRLVPGINAMKDAVGKVRDSLSRGEYEPAIGVAQTFIAYAVSYQEQLEQLNEVFENGLTKTESALCSLQHKRDDSLRSIEEMQREIEGLIYKNDKSLDYWTVGAFGQVEDKINSAIMLMNSGVDTFNVEELEKAEKLFNEIRRQIELCQQIAEMQFGLSCHCQSVAYNAAIVVSLDNNNSWCEQGQGFINSDARGTYMYSLNDGNHVLNILVSPDRENDNVQCRIEVYEADGNRDNPIECDIIRNGIISELQKDNRTMDYTVHTEVSRESIQKNMINGAKEIDEEALATWKNKIDNIVNSISA